MFIDLAKEKPPSLLRADVAIVGSGPAGLTLARRLAAAGREVLLVESGGLSYSDAAQELNRGDDAGGRTHYLRASRIRSFGGTSFHWAGWCRTLDPLDFTRRSWVNHSGWPIAYEDVAPYYKEAASICDLDGPAFDAESWSKTRNQQVLPWKEGDFETSYFQLSPPTRFGTKYRGDIEKSAKITTLLNATVTGIRLESNAASCKALSVVGPDAKTYEVIAQRYVVACGGIENARLLLNSNDVTAGGVGNAHDLVGRYFMDHPAFSSGMLVPADPSLNVDLYIYDSHPKFRGFGTLAPSHSLMKRLNSVHFNIEMIPTFEGTANSMNEIKSAYWTLAQRAKRGEVFSHFGDNLSLFFSMIGSGASYAWGTVARSERKLLSVALRHHLECSPNAESRVTLSADKKDRFGQPQAHLDWRINDADIDGWHRAQEALAVALGKSGLARMRIDYDPAAGKKALKIESSWHHLGTTRMHADPRQGVVDPNCRVHGLSNLYVAGSSVFPTSGHANPTLTIVALALRLGDHLTRDRA